MDTPAPAKRIDVPFAIVSAIVAVMIIPITLFVMVATSLSIGGCCGDTTTEAENLKIMIGVGLEAVAGLAAMAFLLVQGFKRR